MWNRLVPPWARTNSSVVYESLEMQEDEVTKADVEDREPK